MWYLGHPRDAQEKKEINRSIAEWADGDSVAAHYSCDIYIFCSEDFGRTAKRSVLDGVNRCWLQEQFGIRFATLGELAAILSEGVA